MAESSIHRLSLEEGLIETTLPSPSGSDHQKSLSERGRPCSSGSDLLTPLENEFFFKVLGPDRISLASGVIQLLKGVGNHWEHHEFGVFFLVKDKRSGLMTLTLLDIDNGNLLWEQQLYRGFCLKPVECPNLLTFEGDHDVFGLNFSNIIEAESVREQLEKRYETDKEWKEFSAKTKPSGARESKRKRLREKLSRTKAKLIPRKFNMVDPMNQPQTSGQQPTPPKFCDDPDVNECIIEMLRVAGVEPANMSSTRVAALQQFIGPTKKNRSNPGRESIISTRSSPDEGEYSYIEYEKKMKKAEQGVYEYLQTYQAPITTRADENNKANRGSTESQSSTRHRNSTDGELDGTNDGLHPDSSGNTEYEYLRTYEAPISARSKGDDNVLLR
ncbi:unnamed protein product [Bursaphelenchus xylophilus]|uniref:(pine wood nematode) hypothetical protein n=1 Tax=Bursaphelenchus xylophilus TaxID=6326 RepID=A0A1I7RI88_BURXY|nr:unnamed protein product [Bursaphelenchus xylophilus]CAG9115078.1 unnamed protein product [Bursaphelenchus xylophilus]